MSLLASQPLSATIAIAMVLFSTLMFSREWLTSVLLLAAVAYVAVPFTMGGDYVGRILFEIAIATLVILARAVKIAIDGYVTTFTLKLIIVAYTSVTGWIWLQRGAHSKWWIFLSVAGILIVWRIAVSVGGSVASEVGVSQEEASNLTPDVLLERDKAMLEAIYKSTHGRAGHFVTARQISPFLHLATRHQIEVAIHRLLSDGSIDENDYGYALKRRGVEAYERRTSAEKRKSPVSNIFNNYGHVSGVFGQGNDVHGNKFQTAPAPKDLIEALLAAAEQLRIKVPEVQARQIDTAALEVSAASNDPERLGRGTRRLVQIASMLGDIGVPLMKAADAVITAIHG